ncbi:MAG: AMP-binding protein [Rhodospirillaceae bacterium]|jgi:acetyl-CoA synthetase|nr:AMP-binding protein [Rhodospirillaceae bacterium]MBT5243330.1 AMP-binding protein [Rhodospirillaceae bacterium]MBT5561796.1 AMP-binding protein [Rhodospirillaceae bacterium]MBT6240910.1 AMP-binding protein [Rhodospirillaceae bacterium]MBT7137377.1 AMP-binding protein [Rhodospirillaceae bacterium]
MLIRSDSYDKVRDALRWQIPEYFNMGVDVCDKHAERTPDKTALIIEDEDGDVTQYSFLALKKLSNKLANLYVARGLKPGDRVAILLSQSVETGIAHIAAWKAGLISIPMFTLFGEDALEFRLSDCGAKALVTDTENYQKIEAIRDKLPNLETVLLTGSGDFSVDGTSPVSLWKALDDASDAFTPLNTKSEEPGLIIYTSGTTGNPKGALHAHRALLGHLPGVEFPHEFFPKPDDLMWTPADWAWIGGLMNVLMSSWHHGVPVLAQRARKYDPEKALALMARHRVRNTFMPPTALRLMRQVEHPAERFDIDLRTVTCAGEPMGAELLDWGKQALGVTFNEYYGQTECNLVVSNCAELMDVKPGSMGRAVPGHDVEIIDENGQILPPETTGAIAVRSPDPVMFLQYWNNVQATKDKFNGDWLLTGDLGTKDADGYLWFVGRDDDVISSAGYRIGPGEIEDCISKHPAVSLVAVVGVPDPLRTEAVKAFILLREGNNGDPDLENDIRNFVKTRLSPHEYPRHIEFVDDLPMTATGKIRRNVLRDGEKET